MFTKPLKQRQDEILGQFLSRAHRFELRFFFLIDWLPNQSK